MSTYVVGFKPPDEKFNSYRKIWEECEKLDISIPAEVYEFFEGEKPDPQGIIVEFFSNGGISTTVKRFYLLCENAVQIMFDSRFGW